MDTSRFLFRILALVSLFFSVLSYAYTPDRKISITDNSVWWNHGLETEYSKRPSGPIQKIQIIEPCKSKYCAPPTWITKEVHVDKLGRIVQHDDYKMSKHRKNTYSYDHNLSEYIYTKTTVDGSHKDTSKYIVDQYGNTLQAGNFKVKYNQYGKFIQTIRGDRDQYGEYQRIYNQKGITLAEKLIGGHISITPSSSGVVSKEGSGAYVHTTTEFEYNNLKEDGSEIEVKVYESTSSNPNRRFIRHMGYFRDYGESFKISPMPRGQIKDEYFRYKHIDHYGNWTEKVHCQRTGNSDDLSANKIDYECESIEWRKYQYY